MSYSGIYPIEGSQAEAFCRPSDYCCICAGENCDYYVEELDSVIHAECISTFIKSPEGKAIADLHDI